MPKTTYNIITFSFLYFANNDVLWILLMILFQLFLFYFDVEYCDTTYPLLKSV